jgi:hypothetical protein
MSEEYFFRSRSHAVKYEPGASKVLAERAWNQKTLRRRSEIIFELVLTETNLN